MFDNTVVGGLSGIDYNLDDNIYHSISDDRSDINPARFYSFKIEISNNRIDTVIFQKKTTLRNQSGNTFPPSSKAKSGTVDPEALRAWNGDFIWSSEGERIVNNKDTILENPKIFISDNEGNYLDTFQLPDQLRVSATEKGTRRNGGFEGLTFSPDRKFLFASVEEPLYQDGPRAGLEDSTGIVRIIKFDVKTKMPVAQYAYTIDPVAHPVNPPSGFRVNGISDIMCLDKNRLLIIERSYSTGRLSCTIKVYLADLSKAENIRDLQALKNKDVRQASKKLLLNMDNLGIFIDNIEGVTFGPKLSNGSQSLIFIADNNFNSFEKNQVLLFEIIPGN